MQPQYAKIYETIVGSTAYGLNTPTSDIDKKGVAIPDIKHVLGLHPFEQHEIGKDYTIFSLHKFIKLAADCNPNIIEMLYTDEADITFISTFGRTLRGRRDIFLSTKAKHTFSGYAYSQLERIKSHQKWINNPQVKPKQQDFYTTKYRMVDNVSVPHTAFLEHEYDAAEKKWQQYETWKRERNPERAALEAKHGYDSKHGMHLIRLLKMSLEIIKYGKVIVKRPDREELLGIRNGQVPYADLVAYAESLMEELELAYGTSPLPGKVDMTKIEDLLIDLQTEFYGIQIGATK